jgi:hypothetical protein
MGGYGTPLGGGRLSGAVVRDRAGGYRTDLFPVAVGAVADVLVRYAGPAVVLAGVDYVALSGGRAGRGLPHLAEAAGVAPLAVYPEHGAIALAREDLAALLGGLVHWNLHGWDAAQPPRPADVGPQAAAALHLHRRPGRGGGGRGPARVLPHLPGARWFVDSHDDTSLTVESGGPAGESLAHAVVARALRGLLVALVGPAPWRPPGAATVGVSEPPAGAVAHLLAEAPVFELRATDAPGKPGRVRVAFGEGGRGPDRLLGPRVFVPRGHLDYDPPTAAWRLRYH